MTARTPGRGVSGLGTPLEGHPGPAELDLDKVRTDLYEASGDIDGPDAPYNWAALQAMRTAEKLLAEVERLHTWAGLMSVVDEQYPTDVFPVIDDRPEADPGVRVLSLVRHLDRARAVVEAAQAWRRFRNFEYRPGEINFHLITAHHEDLDLARAIDDLVAGLEITTTEPLDTKEAAT